MRYEDAKKQYFDTFAYGQGRGARGGDSYNQEKMVPLSKYKRYKRKYKTEERKLKLKISKLKKLLDGDIMFPAHYDYRGLNFQLPSE